MATINCNISALWNNDTCQNFTGKHYEELKPRLEAIQNPGKEKVAFERVDKQIYHVSSNGYYGYLPILPETTHEDYSMDTNDSDLEIAGVQTTEKGDTSDRLKTENVFSIGITLGRRKRVRGEDNTVEWSKKQRKEEQESVSESCCLVDTEGNYLDLLENLLKETHGCDLYNYVSCDL